MRVFLLLLVALIMGCAGPQIKKNIRQIELGMSESEVISILGEPQRISEIERIGEDILKTDSYSISSGFWANTAMAYNFTERSGPEYYELTYKNGILQKISHKKIDVINVKVKNLD